MEVLSKVLYQVVRPQPLFYQIEIFGSDLNARSYCTQILTRILMLLQESPTSAPISEHPKL
jgi:hypothetical protein